MSDYRIEFDHHGGPDVLEVVEFAPPTPLPGQVLVENRAIGLNFSDIYMRTGQKGPHGNVKFPAVPGANAAGVVLQVGSDVTLVRPGDRVAFVSRGAYATKSLVPAGEVLLLPEFMSFEAAAASLLRGLTAEYLLHRLFLVEEGMDVLVHAAAGGMGQLLCQWTASKGARAIGTVGSAEKAEVARTNGCSVVIEYRKEDFVEAVLAATEGRGVHVVYDAVGKDAFHPSLACLRPMGVIASYGAASGPVPPLDIQELHHNSLFVTRPRLRSYIATPEMLNLSAARFFAAVECGAVTISSPRSYPLREVRRAHSDLESRKTTGACILTP